MYCYKCGRQLPDGSRFCDKCGAVQDAADLQTANNEPAQPAVQSAPEPQTFRFGALNVSGEAAYGTIGNAAAGAVSGAIPGPGKVIAESVRRLIASVAAAFRDPKRLIPALILAVLWLALDILQACGIDPVPTRILSFITFANGGMSGGFIGAIGGILGKGIFAGALVSLIGLIGGKGGVKRSFVETLKGAFGVSLDTLFAYLAGIGAAMLLYLFISGGATRISFAGGIAASFLAARAGLSGGFLKNLLGSFTKSKSPSSPNVSGIVRGLAAGFAAAALIGLTGIDLILIILGSLLLVGGIVMTILQAAGVVKPGKGAGAQ